MYLGIDLGTSSVKTVLMDEAQNIIDSHSAALDVSRPQDGWSEQDPQSWIDATSDTFSALQANQPKAMAAVRGIGLSGQQHGATVLDNSDKPLRPCILWNDTRSASQASVLDTETARNLIGSITFPGFTSPKLRWMAENEPGLFDQVAKVLLPKDYLRLWLSGEHVAEMSDASGTGWLDVNQRDWSDSLLEITGLSTSHMPRLVEGTEVSATLREELARQFGLPAGVPIAGGAGDNAASACGMGTVRPGDAFLSLGTSGVLFASNESYRPNAESAVHTFCHALPATWHQMGVILAATDALNWWAGVVGETPQSLTSALDGKEDTSPGPIFLPYLGGERTPINDAAARGAFIGLGHSADQEVMTRAVLQGVSFAFLDSLQALATAGTELQSAIVLGGGSQSSSWLQMLADTLGIPLQTCDSATVGASYGAARLGLIAAEAAEPLSVCSQPPISAELIPNKNKHVHLQEQHYHYQSLYQALRQQRDGDTA